MKCLCRWYFSLFTLIQFKFPHSNINYTHMASSSSSITCRCTLTLVPFHPLSNLGLPKFSIFGQGARSVYINIYEVFQGLIERYLSLWCVVFLLVLCLTSGTSLGLSVSSQPRSTFSLLYNDIKPSLKIFFGYTTFMTPLSNFL